MYTNLARLVVYAAVCFALGSIVWMQAEQTGFGLIQAIGPDLVAATGQEWVSPYQWVSTAGQAIAIGGPIIMGVLALLTVTSHEGNPNA